MARQLGNRSPTFALDLLPLHAFSAEPGNGGNRLEGRNVPMK